jgi:hypothetical protein
VTDKYVKIRPVSCALMARASTDQVLTVSDDGTLRLKIVSGGGA